MEAIFSVGMKKVEGTENDYELMIGLNPAFEGLSADKFEDIKEISTRAVKEIQEVLKR